MLTSGTLSVEVLFSDASYGDMFLAWDLVRFVGEALDDAERPEWLDSFYFVPQSVYNLTDAVDPEDDPDGYYQDGQDYSYHAVFRGVFYAHGTGSTNLNDVYVCLHGWLNGAFSSGLCELREIQIHEHGPVGQDWFGSVHSSVDALFEQPEVTDAARASVLVHTSGLGIKPS